MNNNEVLRRLQKVPGILSDILDINISIDNIKKYNLKGNVMDYGAKGDGITDDTEAFKQALIKNICVEVPGGTFLISDSLDLKSGQALVGFNKEKTIIKMKDYSDKHIIKITENVSNCIVKSINLNHGVQGYSLELAGLYVASETESTSGGQFHLIEDILISNPCEYGLYVGHHTGDSTFSNITVTGNARQCGVKIIGHDSYYNNITVLGAKEFGIHCTGNQNKFVNCKTYYCGDNYNSADGIGDGYFFSSANCMISNCEAQENARHGVYFYNCSHYNVNMLLDTNGRNKAKGGNNIVIDECKKNNFTLNCNNWSGGLNGLVKNHIELKGDSYANNINITCGSDSRSETIKVNNDLGIIGNYVIVNGSKYNSSTNLFSLDVNENSRNVIKGFNLSFTGVACVNESKIDYINGKQIIKGSNPNNYQGIAMISDYITSANNQALAFLKLDVNLGSCECRFDFYDSNKQFMWSSNASDRITIFNDKESFLKFKWDLPVECSYVKLRTECYNDGTSPDFDVRISDIKVCFV